MSQQGNFLGGFLLGTLVGGAVGGVIGAMAASRLSQTETNKLEGSKPEGKAGRKASLKASSSQNIEVARRGLEDKIAQLNHAIDDVRQQLGSVNGSMKEEPADHPVSPEP